MISGDPMFKHIAKSNITRFQHNIITPDVYIDLDIDYIGHG